MKYEYETHTESPRNDVFDWFERRGSFRRLMPPWEVAEEVSADETLENGAQRIFRFPMGPIKMGPYAKILKKTSQNNYRFKSIMLH